MEPPVEIGIRVENNYQTLVRPFGMSLPFVTTWYLVVAADQWREEIVHGRYQYPEQAQAAARQISEQFEGAVLSAAAGDWHRRRSDDLWSAALRAEATLPPWTADQESSRLWLVERGARRRKQGIARSGLDPRGAGDLAAAALVLGHETEAWARLAEAPALASIRDSRPWERMGEGRRRLENVADGLLPFSDRISLSGVGRAAVAHGKDPEVVSFGLEIAVRLNDRGSLPAMLRQARDRKRSDLGIEKAIRKLQLEPEAEVLFADLLRDSPERFPHLAKQP